MTRSHDQNRQWRMYCDQDGCETRSEPFPAEPPLQMFQERGWFIAELFGDACPACLARGVHPTVEPHRMPVARGGAR